MTGYRKLNTDIERISELYFLVSLRFSIPVAILPALITTILNYFVYDLSDDDTYDLPHLVLYVLKNKMIKKGKIDWN